MNGIPLEVNQSVMFRYRFERASISVQCWFESALIELSAFNDDDRKSLGSQKSIPDLLFLIVITLGYRARLGGDWAAVCSTAMGIWEHGRGYSRGVPSIQTVSRRFQPLVDGNRGASLSLTVYSIAHS